MTSIILYTEINASAEKCYDLSRDVDIHLKSTKKTNERAIAGRTNGLFEVNDTTTWEATHFGIRQQLSIRMIKMDRPHYFEEIMTKGAFKSMRHEHYFEEKDGKTVMKDVFEYETPFSIAGKIFDVLVLKRYMTRFLIERNNVIKEVAESNP